MADSVYIGWLGPIKFSSSGSSISFAGSLLPSADNTYDLGSASFQWRSLYLGTSLVMGTVSVSNGAANRLDLASGDSLYLVSGGLGVGVTPPAAGKISASDSVTATNFVSTAGYYGNAAGTKSFWFAPNDGQVVFTNAATTAASAVGLGLIASATSTYKLVKKVTGIADNTATDVLTVTVPNANHAATIKITLLSSNGSTDAFESSRTAMGAVVLARTTGANAVAAVATLTLAQIATVAAGATHTLAYGVSAISGAVGATNTFTVQVTIDDSGNLGSNQCVVLAELVNAEATGVTIA